MIQENIENFRVPLLDEASVHHTKTDGKDAYFLNLKKESDFVSIMTEISFHQFCGLSAALNTSSCVTDLSEDFDRHFYLYAKMHYKETEFIDDMKTLISKRCNMDKEFVLLWDILRVVLKLALSHIVPAPCIDQTRAFIIDMLKGYMDHTPDLKTLEVCICKCMSILSSVTVLNKERKEIFKIGKADPKVLPLAEHEKSKHKPGVLCVDREGNEYEDAIEWEEGDRKEQLATEEHLRNQQELDD